METREDHQDELGELYPVNDNRVRPSGPGTGQGRASSQRLLQLQQGSSPAADYAIQFRILAADSGWNDTVNIAEFRKRLSLELQLELSCRDSRLGLDDLITLVISLDQHLRSTARLTDCTSAQPKASGWP